MVLDPTYGQPSPDVPASPGGPLSQTLHKDAVGLLAELGQNFAATLDIEACLHQALARIIAYLGAEAGSLFLLDESGQTLTCRSCEGPVDITGLTLPAGKGIVGASIREGCCQMVRDVRENPDFESGVDAKTGFETHSILCAPLQVRETCLGAIEVINKSGSDKLFTESDRSVLEALCGSAALAILNARMAVKLVGQERLKRELELAGEIQRALLPTPRPPPFPIWGINKPARGVSGDFYDFFQIEDGRLGFSLGDVSGKGMNAALLMAKTASLYRCLGRGGMDPGALLAAVNREICETSMFGMFVTMVGGIFEPATGELVLANAGHEPALIHDGAGKFTTLEAEAPPLGIDPESSFPQSERNIKGCALYIFSDGLSEAPLPEGGMLGGAGVRKLLKAHGNLPLGERLDTIVATAIKGQEDLHDDVTLLGVEA